MRKELVLCRWLWLVRASPLGHGYLFGDFILAICYLLPKDIWKLKTGSLFRNCDEELSGFRVSEMRKYNSK
jgi:hypothetical protein